MRGEFQIVEYLWTDKFNSVRGKTKVIDTEIKSIEDLPVWSFDGSSTGQACGHSSDVFLRPRRIYSDPFRGSHHKLILCDCFDDFELQTPNESNSRIQLEKVAKEFEAHEPWFGIEQEYVLYSAADKLPYKWKTHQEPGAGPQGPYYCGAGGDRAFGRAIVEEHMFKCLEAGVKYCGLNAEVMPSQWEFQVGASDPLKIADDLTIARYILARITEKYDVMVSYHPKPHLGDWNGSGGHVNFSTKAMRAENGIEEIKRVMSKLAISHKEDMKLFGEENHLRLTGKHETSSMEKFSWGVGDRGASARITKQVEFEKKGYLEDRRPASNLDPYLVLSIILKSSLS